MDQYRCNLAKIYSEVCLEFISVSEAEEFISCFPGKELLPLLVKLESMDIDYIINIYINDISKVFQEVYEGKFFDLLTAVWKDLIYIKRLSILPQIAYEIEKLIIKSKNKISVEFKTANILHDQDKVKIKDTLVKLLKSDLEITWSYDRSILSGYQIILGDWKLNSSGLHYISQLRSKLIGI